MRCKRCDKAKGTGGSRSFSWERNLCPTCYWHISLYDIADDAKQDEQLIDCSHIGGFTRFKTNPHDMYLDIYTIQELKNFE